MFIESPSIKVLTSMHFYAWQKGLKTGIYYFRTKPGANAIKFTIDTTKFKNKVVVEEEEDEGCLNCSA